MDLDKLNLVWWLYLKAEPIFTTLPAASKNFSFQKWLKGTPKNNLATFNKVDTRLR